MPRQPEGLRDMPENMSLVRLPPGGGVGSSSYTVHFAVSRGCGWLFFPGFLIASQGEAGRVLVLLTLTQSSLLGRLLLCSGAGLQFKQGHTPR